MKFKFNFAMLCQLVKEEIEWNRIKFYVEIVECFCDEFKFKSNSWKRGFLDFFPRDFRKWNNEISLKWMGDDYKSPYIFISHISISLKLNFFRFPLFGNYRNLFISTQSHLIIVEWKKNQNIFKINSIINSSTWKIE